MGSHKNDPSGVIIRFDELLPGQKRLVADISQHFRKGRRAAEHKLMPLSEHLPVCCGKYLQILIRGTVDDDFSEVGHRSKFFRNGFHFPIAQFFPGN